MPKAIIIKICILFVLLLGLTVLFARQDVVLRVVFHKDTLIRNGRTVVVSLDTGNDEWVTIQAQTPHYSIYEYNVQIPASIWSKTTQVGLEFGQVRKGDLLYIEAIAVKRSFFDWVTIQHDTIAEDMRNVTSAEATITDENLVELTVLSTRAQAGDLSAEGPSFSLPIKSISASGMISLTYILCVLSVIAVWFTAAFAVPKKAYVFVWARLCESAKILRCFSVMDYAIVFFGICSLVLYHLGSRLPFGHSNFTYNILSIVTILFISIKWIASPPAADCSDLGDNGSAGLPKPVPYIILLILSILVYIPAIFPSPYYWNDEFFVVGAADWFLKNGNYDYYDRAWPHTWMVAQAIKLFDISTASTRAVSALCGTVFIVSAYHIIRKMSKKNNIAFWAAVLLLCNPFLVSIFTMVRMYAVLMPVSLWLFYCIYRTLHCEIEYKRDNAVTRFIKNQFNFHFFYAAATILLMWLVYHIHNNAMIIPLCAALYVFLTAALKRQRKFINLSIAGTAVILLFGALYLIDAKTPADVPVIPSLINYMLNFSGFGWYNYDYFWNNINVPLGPFLGIFFMLIALCMCFKAAKGQKSGSLRKSNTSFIIYAMLCYIITVAFFIFLADRYYEYVYMSFLTPVTMLLVLTGADGLATKIKSSTRLAVNLLIVAAITLQICSTFSWIYIDKPERTKFARPYQTLANDAKAEGLDTVSLYATLYRNFYFSRFVRGIDRNVIGSVRGQAHQIDYLIDRIDISEQPVVYFFSEQDKNFSSSQAFMHFLENATDTVTYIDSSIIHKFHFIEAVPAAKDSNDANNDTPLRITDMSWDNDVAYIHCEIDYMPKFDGAVIIAVEVAEQGIVQSSSHRYQVLVPEHFKAGDMISFTLPVHPRTEEYSENLTFNIEEWFYVYYGKDISAVIPR